MRSFLTAGVDTTVNGLANMLHAFAAHPGEWSKLRADPALAKKAFEESLRWSGTVQTFFRTTARDVPFGDNTIPAGAKVILYLAAANRDPREVFADWLITRDNPWFARSLVNRVWSLSPVPSRPTTMP